MENLRGIMKTLDKSHTGDQFVVKIDASTKNTLKLVFSKLLNQLSTSIQLEQTFCQEFFNIKSNLNNDSYNLTSVQKMSRNSSDTSLVSNNTILSKNTNKQSESKYDLYIIFYCVKFILFTH
jgi:hypothetical protein